MMLVQFFVGKYLKFQQKDKRIIHRNIEIVETYTLVHVHCTHTHTCECVLCMHICNYLVVYHWFSANRNTSGITSIFVNGQMLQVTFYRCNCFMCMWCWSFGFTVATIASITSEWITHFRRGAHKSSCVTVSILLTYRKSISNVYHMWKHLSKCQLTRPTCNKWVGLPHSLSLPSLSLFNCVCTFFRELSSHISYFCNEWKYEINMAVGCDGGECGVGLKFCESKVRIPTK